MPTLYIFAGCNGAGKSTVARTLLPILSKDMLFINADEIALKIADSPGGSTDIKAGRMMLEHMQQLVHQGIDFAFETTLSSRSLAPDLISYRELGYNLILYYVVLETPDLSVTRVTERVKKGGHSIPEPIIRRRYERSLDNFHNLYVPIVDYWFVFDNSRNQIIEVARGARGVDTLIFSSDIWKRLLRYRK